MEGFYPPYCNSFSSFCVLSGWGQQCSFHAHTKPTSRRQNVIFRRKSDHLHWQRRGFRSVARELETSFTAELDDFSEMNLAPGNTRDVTWGSWLSVVLDETKSFEVVFFLHWGTWFVEVKSSYRTQHVLLSVAAHGCVKTWWQNYLFWKPKMRLIYFGATHRQTNQNQLHATLKFKRLSGLRLGDQYVWQSLQLLQSFRHTVLAIHRCHVEFPKPTRVRLSKLNTCLLLVHVVEIFVNENCFL